MSLWCWLLSSTQRSQMDSMYTYVYNNGHSWWIIKNSNFSLISFFSEPPSSPQNLTINFLDQSTVILTWNKPKFLGGRNDTVYRISCDYCPSSTNYVPSQETINDTRVVISGLNPMTSYRFQVYAENGVSGYDSSQFVEITATTEASGRQNQNVNVANFSFIFFFN